MSQQSSSSRRPSELERPAIVLWRQVFDLQTKALPLERSGKEAPPAHPPPGWKAGVNARQKVSGKLPIFAVKSG